MDEWINSEKIKTAFPTIKDLYENKWHTSRPYELENIEKFTGGRIPDAIKENLTFQAAVYYILTLYDIVCYNAPRNTLPEPIVKELFEWENNGGQCIYLSALMYSILLESGVVNENEITFCQGMYHHPPKEGLADSLFGLVFGRDHVGLHCWLEIGGGIFDLSIRQEEQFFDFKGEPFIAGEVPDGLTLLGYRETKDVAKKHCRNAAKKSGSYYLEWEKAHRLAAHKHYMEYLQEELEH